MLVTTVQKNSVGEKAGLRAGDVVTKVDGQAIRNLGGLRDQLSEKRDAGSIALGLVRNQKEIFATVQLARPQTQQL